MATSLPVLLPLPEAARKYGLTVARLKSMIEHGKIKAAMMMDTLVVDEDEVRAKTVQRKEDLPEYKKHAHLKGVPIWVSEASRKYQIADRTIINWIKKGFIKTLGYDKNRRLIDEADVAYCAEVYNQNKGQGKWPFDEHGLPRKKTGPLAL